MRSLLLHVSLILITLTGAYVPAADLTAEQQAAIERVIDFSKHMGAMGDKKSTDLADRLQKAVREKKLSFGQVPDNDNAIADPLTGKIVLKETFVREVNSGADEALTDKAELAATVAHEFEHLDQYSLYIVASKASQKAGKGNPAEQEAWNKGFDRMAGWIAQMKKELDRQQKDKERFRDQAWTAKQLRFLCNAWGTYRNSYAVKRKDYGEILVINPADPTGKRVPMDVALADVEELRNEAIGDARIGDQMAVPFDGLYDGTVDSGRYGRQPVVGVAKGEITFLIRGTTVEANLKCTNMLWESLQKGNFLVKDKNTKWFEYKLRGTIDVDGNVRLKTISGYSLEIEGNFSNGIGKGIFRPADRNQMAWGVWEVKQRAKKP